MVEATVIQSENELPRCEQGQIWIQIENETQGIFAGKHVSGAVLVNLTKKFDAKNIQLSLYGCEDVIFTNFTEDGVGSTHTALRDICDIRFNYKDCADDVQPAGQFSFPFEILIPDWIPPSTMFCNSVKKAQFQVRYELRAQLIPVQMTDWAQYQNSIDGISKLRGSRSIFISQPIEKEFPSLNYQQQLNVEIGGVFGLGSSKCSTTVHFMKNEYFTGQKAQIRIVCDNSQCDKKVKSFKFKLFKEFFGMNQSMKAVSQGGGYVSVVKQVGIPAKTKCDKIFEVDLPANDFSSYDGKIPFTDRQGASFSGNFFSVRYSLNVFVKHDSWNEFGEGSSVSFPIRIHQSPVCGAYNRLATDFNQLPSQWQPTKGLKKKFNFEEVKFSYVYLSDVVDAVEKEWKARMMPHILTKEEVKVQEQGTGDKKVAEVVAEFEMRMSLAAENDSQQKKK